MGKYANYPFWDIVLCDLGKRTSRILNDEIKRDFIEDLDKDIYIFGCNEASKYFIKLYDEKLNIIGVLDNDVNKQKGEFATKKVFSPKQLIPKLSKNNTMIIVGLRLNSSRIIENIKKQYGYNNVCYMLDIIMNNSPYKDFFENIRIIKNNPLDNIIMFESTNDLDGNSGALYEYIKKKNLNYKIVWVLKNKINAKKLISEEDDYVCPPESEEDMKKYIKYIYKSRWQIWDNMPIIKVRDNQTNVFLQHFGMGYKQSKNVYRAPYYVDYVLTTNENVYAYMKDVLIYDTHSKIIYSELPRNDVLVEKKWNELGKITKKKFSKVIMWAPTLRISNSSRKDSDREYPYGISLIYEDDTMENLNQYLKINNNLLIIKIHPRQNYKMSDKNYSNILYLNSENISNVHAYKLLTQVDALISDYSSIVFDYMILDRPIAWVLEDIDDFKMPFIMENPMAFMPGEKIFKYNDLITFLNHVNKNMDIFREERECISKKFNAPVTGNGCKRLVEILGI